MQFARKVVNAEDIIGIIELPEELRRREVEIIVLPVNHAGSNQDEAQDEEDMIDRLLASPLHIDGFKPFSREEIYE